MIDSINKLRHPMKIKQDPKNNAVDNLRWASPKPTWKGFAEAFKGLDKYYRKAYNAAQKAKGPCQTKVP